MTKKLSTRELEVLDLLIREELSSREIAERLSISVGTVDTHRKKILKKTNTTNAVGLTKFSILNNLIPIKTNAMKKTLILFAMIIGTTNFVGAQPQPQGEYHKYILKKTDAERRKTKNQEWWNKGVIKFAKEDIARLGKIKEVESMLADTFHYNEKFVGRVYNWQSVGQMKPKPVSIWYTLLVDGKKVKTRVIQKDDGLPESAWSSWLLDFPEYFEGEWEAMDPGTHNCRVECWVSYTVDETTIYKDDNGKTVGAITEEKGRTKFLAAGDFVYIR